MTNLLASQSPVEWLLAMDAGQEVAVGAHLVTVVHSAPGCPEGHFLLTDPAGGTEQAWFTSAEERLDQALALVDEYGEA